MIKGIDLIEDSGFVFPASAKEYANRYVKHMKDCEPAYKYVKKFDVAIQAGACCGLFPRFLSEKFNYVYTFEPIPENFYCTCLNLADKPNVFKYQGIIGKRAGTAHINYNSGNIGGHKVAPNQTEGNFIQFKLDDFNLPACDFIQFDIEGKEVEALIGFENTIKKFSPVIQLEINSCLEKQGYSEDDLRTYLSSLGYSEAEKVAKDHIFIRR